MKLIVKRIYCTHCQRLVKGVEQSAKGSNLAVTCPRCRKTLWSWNGLVWRHVKVG